MNNIQTGVDTRYLGINGKIDWCISSIELLKGRVGTLQTSSSGGGTVTLAIGDTVTGSSQGSILWANAGLLSQGNLVYTPGSGGPDSFIFGTATLVAPAFAHTYTFPASTGTIALTSNLTNAAFLNVNQSWTAGQAGAFVELTDASTIAVNMALANNFNIVLGGNRTLGVPTNISPGQSGVLNIYQDSTGSRLLTYSWMYQFANGVSPVLSTGKFAVDQLTYMVNYYEANGLNSISIASPCVITYNTHKLKTGQRIQITTTGALPTGLSQNTTYWVTPIDTNTFNVSTSFANCQAGTFINTTGSQSGLPSFSAGSITITGANLNLQ